MPKTMAYKFCRQKTMILVHTKEPPSDDEWKAYIQDAATLRDRIKGFLVISEGGGPNTLQRGELNELMEVEKRGQKTAVVTVNRIARGIVTAMGWFNPGIKAFSTINVQAALEYLGVPANEYDDHLVDLKKLKAELGIAP